VSTQDYIEKDYYKVLGVAKDADTKTIKKAFNKIAKESHPDHNPDDAKAEARFKEASEAYSVLSDADKRKEYDETRAMFAGGGFRPGGFGGGGFGGAGAPGGTNVNFDLSDLFGGGGGGGASSIFDTIFGDTTAGRGGARRRGPAGPGPAAAARGADQEATISLSFEEAVRGSTLPLSLTAPGTCTLCAGTGAKPGTSMHTCPTCGGAGSVNNNMGGFGFSEPCRTCRGKGRIPDDPCPQCHGSGVANQTRNIQVRVPSGIKDGAKLRLAGKGSPGTNGGPSGDLFVTVRVGAHPLFGRKDDNLTLTVPISFTEAALGTTLRVPTLDGAVSLKVPAGTPSGRTLRVRGRGVTTKKGTGDLLVTVEVAVPAKVNQSARDALEAYALAMPDDPRPHITAALPKEPSDA
jgi:molecular chaperone DnaJ